MEIVCDYFFVCIFVGLGLSNTVGLGAVSGVNSGVEFLTGNILLLKLLIFETVILRVAYFVFFIRIFY